MLQSDNDNVCIRVLETQRNDLLFNKNYTVFSIFANQPTSCRYEEVGIFDMTIKFLL